MAAGIRIDDPGPVLREAVAQLRPGEKANLVAPDGRRVALIVAVRPECAQPMSHEEWMAEWRALSQEISKAWKSDKSAVELIAEMRR